MESREGAAIPNIYGRMRVGGQVIWASRFTEQRKREQAGGKGGPKVTTYDYTVSLAVALCEGEITRVHRAWANNEPFDLSTVVHRVYRGGEDQPADPLIEMIEGAGHAPAYRGMAYIVLKICRWRRLAIACHSSHSKWPAAPETSNALSATVTGVNIIPASGEFVYATEIIREQTAPGISRPLNANTGEARAGFSCVA